MQQAVPKQSLRHDVIPRHSAPGPQSAPSALPPEVEPPEVEPPDVVPPPLLPGSLGDDVDPPDGAGPTPGAVAAPLSHVVAESRSVVS